MYGHTYMPNMTIKTIHPTFHQTTIHRNAIKPLKHVWPYIRRAIPPLRPTTPVTTFATHPFLPLVIPVAQLAFFALQQPARRLLIFTRSTTTP